MTDSVPEDRVDIKYSGIPNVCFSLTDSDDDREEEYAKQRKERGFDNSELWSLDSTIAKFIYPRLKEYRDCQAGYPGCFDSEEPWNEILDKILLAFKLLSCDDLCGELAHDAEIKEGLELFARWFRSLWI